MEERKISPVPLDPTQESLNPSEYCDPVQAVQRMDELERELLERGVDFTDECLDRNRSIEVRARGARNFFRTECETTVVDIQRCLRAGELYHLIMAFYNKTEIPRRDDPELGQAFSYYAMQQMGIAGEVMFCSQMVEMYIRIQDQLSRNNSNLSGYTYFGCIVENWRKNLASRQIAVTL